MKNTTSEFKKFWNIGDSAKLSGVSVKMIRHYEEIGLMPKAVRTSSGYRNYDENAVHLLRFIRRARDLGFSIVEIKKLVSLWRNKSRTSSEVKILAAKHIKELEVKIKELQAMRKTLSALASCCRGDDRPECPILEELSHGQ